MREWAWQFGVVVPSDSWYDRRRLNPAHSGFSMHFSLQLVMGMSCPSQPGTSSPW